MLVEKAVMDFFKLGVCVDVMKWDNSLKVGDVFIYYNGAYYGIITEVFKNEISWQWYSMEGVEVNYVRKMPINMIHIKCTIASPLLKELL